MAIDIEAPGANEADLMRALSNLREFRGCRVRMTADDVTQNITGEAAVSFDAADFDTDSLWSAGSPTRLTIPAGVGYVAVSGQALVTLSTADTHFSVAIRLYNSANVLQKAFGTRFIETGGATKMLAAHTGPCAVATGDYFQLWIREETDNSVTIEGDDANQTYLALDILGMS
jgi:hypothetical protein